MKRWLLAAVAVLVLSLAVGTTNEVEAQPYGGASPGGSSISIANVAIGLESIATLPAEAVLISGTVAQPAANFSIAIVALGPDGSPVDGTEPRVIPATLNAETLEFRGNLPTDLSHGTYALYVNDVFVGRFAIPSAAGPPPDGAAGDDGGFGLGSTAILLLAVLLAIALVIGGLFFGRARGY